MHGRWKGEKGWAYACVVGRGSCNELVFIHSRAGRRTMGIGRCLFYALLLASCCQSLSASETVPKVQDEDIDMLAEAELLAAGEGGGAVAFHVAVMGPLMPCRHANSWRGHAMHFVHLYPIHS